MFTKHKVRPDTEGKLDELSLKTWLVPGGSRDDRYLLDAKQNMLMQLCLQNVDGHVMAGIVLTFEPGICWNLNS